MHTCLAWEGLHRRHVDLHILLDNVEDGAIVKIIDTHKVAHLNFLIDVPPALTCHKETNEMTLVIVWPFLLNALARVEEQCQSRA